MTGDRKYLLAECRLPEVEAQLQRSPRILIPLGATEQHGPHAPFGTDSLLASEVCARLARRIDALVAPAVPYGVSGDHHGFAGVPYVSVPTLSGVIRDLAVSFTGGGFKHVVFVNGHYTNSIAIHAALFEAHDQLPSDAIVYGFNYWDPLPPEQGEAYLGFREGLHANVGETSAVMAIDPSLVDLESAVAEYPTFPGGPSAALVSAFFLSGKGRTYRATRSGVWGDPRSSTAEKGLTFFEQIEEACVRFMQGVEQTFELYPERP
jgi:creatinine amidohydrolase/Fe(II)-dependent formamide hydrolase-like protein